MKSFALAVLALLNAPLALAESQFTATTGLDISSGKYGQDSRTDTVVVPVSLKYEVDDWTFRAMIPYVHTHGPASVIGNGLDQVTIDSGKTGTRSVAGLGDVVLSVGWNALQNGPWLVELMAKVKLPTADSSKGLGTGQRDVSLQVDLYRAFGQHTLLATLGQKHTGDPAGTALNDPLFSSLGWMSKLSATTTIGSSVDYRQKLQDSGASVREINGFLIYKLDRHWKLQTYLVKGFSRASPELGGGAFISHAF